jgi:chromosome segregation ATPase
MNTLHYTSRTKLAVLQSNATDLENIIGTGFAGGVRLEAAKRNLSEAYAGIAAILNEEQATLNAESAGLSSEIVTCRGEIATLQRQGAELDGQIQILSGESDPQFREHRDKIIQDTRSAREAEIKDLKAAAADLDMKAKQLLTSLGHYQL